MFKSNHSKRGGGGVPTIFRLFLSLFIMAFLGFGLLQAYRSFSGVDPLSLSPEFSIKSLLSSEGVYKFITGLLSVSPGTSLNRAKDLLKDPNSQAKSNDNSQADSDTSQSALSFKFVIVTDSHNDNNSLKKALSQAKEDGAKYIVGTGDWTDVGTVAELQAAKTVFEGSGLPYYLTAGDHDLWDARNKKLNAQDEYIQVFGSPYRSFSYQNSRSIIIYNSDDYLGLDGLELNWVETELKKAQEEGKTIFMFAHTPLFHPSSDHQMGRINDKLKNQAEHIISLSQKAGVAAVFSGDTHMFSEYKEPTTDLKMATIGAVTSTRNPQAPRFAIISVFEDGTYTIEDIEIH